MELPDWAPPRPEGMDEWRSRADYTHIVGGRVQLTPEAVRFLEDCVDALRGLWGERVLDQPFRSACAVLDLCALRSVFPVLTPSGVHIPDELVPGWSWVTDKQRRHGKSNVLATGSLSMALGSYPSGPERKVLDGPNCADVVEWLRPVCITQAHKPRGGWHLLRDDGTGQPEGHLLIRRDADGNLDMDRADLERLAVQVDAALAGRRLKVAP